MTRSLAAETGSPSYLPEIDGIRCIAISTVLFFHYSIPGFSGGFIGVDVFFVVSGYLITRNILREIELGRFSLAGFYTRRIRRIYPSFLATAIVVLIAGFLIMPPSMFENTARASIYSSLFASNIFFWMQVGYFDAEKYTKPLLHTWSLGIEEQFYLFWPIAILLLLRFLSLRAALATVVAGMLASMGLAIFWVESTVITIPGLGSAFTDIPDAFYLLPFRVWELAIGGCLAFAPVRQCFAEVPSAVARVLSAAALAAIVWCCLTYSPEMAFPGLAALLPCLAAATLILFARNSPFASVSATSVVRRLGQQSYAIYLTHWPIIVFYRLYYFEPPGPAQTLLLIALSIASAELLSRFVEVPFRTGRLATKAGMRPVAWFLLLAGFVGVGASAGSVVASNGLPSRMLAETQPADKENQYARIPPSLSGLLRYPQFGGIWQVGAESMNASEESQSPIRGIVIGDSHAGHFSRALDRIGRGENVVFDYWTFVGCPPIFGTYKIYWRSGLRVESQTQVACRQQIRDWERAILAGKYDLVVLAARWTHLFEDTRYGELEVEFAQLAEVDTPVGSRKQGREIFESHLRETVEKIGATGAQILLVGQVPNLGRPIEGCRELSRFLYSARDATRLIARRCGSGVTRETATSRLAYSDKVFESLAGRKGVWAFLPGRILCPDQQPRCTSVADGLPLHRDADHLSSHGQDYLQPFLQEVVRAAVAAGFNARSPEENAMR